VLGQSHANCQRKLSVKQVSYSGIVVFRHGFLNAYGAKCLNHFNGKLYPGFKRVAFCFIPASQHIVNLGPFREGGIYSKAQSRVIIGAQGFIYIFQAVMASVIAFLPHSQFAKWYGQIVQYNQNILQLNFFFLHPVIHSLPAEVYKCGRFDEDKGSPFVFISAGMCVFVEFKGEGGCFRDCV